MIVTLYASNFVKDWHVTEEVSCSDHRYIRSNIAGIDLWLKSFAILAELTESPLEPTCWVAGIV
jgi:tRNA U55 pseudouridine synthase TruB